MAEYFDGSIPTIVCEDFSELENDICYNGRHPLNDDEIAIGSAFADSFSIGDRFRLTLNGTSHEYTVSGFIQSVNNNGTIAELTNDGYGNISDTPLYSLSLYMGDEDVDGYINKLDGEYSDYTVNVSNAAKETKAMQAMYALQDAENVQVQIKW